MERGTYEVRHLRHRRGRQDAGQPIRSAALGEGVVAERHATEVSNVGADGSLATSIITILNPSGSRTCISRNPHGLSVGSSIISTAIYSRTCPTAWTSRTCNNRLKLSLDLPGGR